MIQFKLKVNCLRTEFNDGFVRPELIVPTTAAERRSCYGDHIYFIRSLPKRFFKTIQMGNSWDESDPNVLVVTLTKTKTTRSKFKIKYLGGRNSVQVFSLRGKKFYDRYCHSASRKLFGKKNLLEIEQGGGTVYAYLELLNTRKPAKK